MRKVIIFYLVVFRILPPITYTLHIINFKDGFMKKQIKFSSTQKLSPMQLEI